MNKDEDENKHLTKKELAKRYRREAYLRAKEFRKTDPHQIAIQEELKAAKREAYQKAKEKNKAFRLEQKQKVKNKKEKMKAGSRVKLLETLSTGSTVKK